MARRKREPDHIGALLQRWIRKNRLGDDLLRHTLRQRWPEVVGERLAARTRPETLYKGRLKVVVANSTWLNELTYMRQEIIDRITEVMGRPMVRELDLKLGRPRPPGPPAPREVRRPSPPAPPRPREPVPETVQRQVEQAVATLEDPELREAVRDAWLEELARKEAGRNYLVSTEGAEAPVWQGAKRAHTGSTQPMSNTARADGSAPECKDNLGRPPEGAAASEEPE